LCPHHCSWHSLSHDSWSELRNKGRVSEDALNALSQARDGATIVASSIPVLDNGKDPPCVGAKREYNVIAKKAAGSFECVGERPSEQSPGIMVVEIGAHGPRLRPLLMGAPAIVGTGAIGRQPLAHGAGR